MKLLGFKSMRRSLEAFLLSLQKKNRREIEPLKNRYNRQSVFLVGSAPSLKKLPLHLLFDADIPFFMVNSGVRLAKGHSVPFHVVSDQDCFIENYSSWRDLQIQHGFYRKRFRRLPQFDEAQIAYPVTWVPNRNGGILKRNFQTDLVLGVGNDSSVLCFAAQICFYLGFEEVFVIGCDLSYEQGNEYAYEMTEADKFAESSTKTQEKRNALTNTNDEFAIIRQTFEQDNRSIFNCGIGGRLEALPRLSFEEAIVRAKPRSQS